MKYQVRHARVKLFALVAVAALVVAVRGIGQQTILSDEAVYADAGWQYVHGVVTANLEHPPTAKYLFGVAQLIVGRGVLGPRLVSAGASLGTGLILFAWLRPCTGYWWALADAGLWWLMPRSTVGSVAIGETPRIDRLALLEPVMVFFAVAALAAAWCSATAASRTGARRTARRFAFPAVCWSALSGALFALSVTSKASTAVLVVLVLAPVLFGRWRAALLGAFVSGASFLLVVAAVYAPVGGASAIRYMVRFQSAHEAHGHTIALLGRVYASAPWWVNVADLLTGVGPLPTAVLTIGIAAALMIRPERLVWLLTAALALIVGFYCSLHVALGYYYFAWMPFVIALAAIGLAKLSRLRPQRTRVIAMLLLAAMIVPASQSIIAAVQTRPTGFARLNAALASHGVTGRAVLLAEQQIPPAVYLKDRAFREGTDGVYSAIVVGTDTRSPMGADLSRFLRVHRAELEHFDVDSLHVWIPRHGAIVVHDGRTRLGR